MIIKIKKYYFLFLLLLFGCVDNLPITIADSGIKYFVVCEMIPGEDILATVNLTGNLSGKLPAEIPLPEDLILSVTEGDKDFAVNFIYDEATKKFKIYKNSLNLKIGETYKIREGSGSFFTLENDVKVQIPAAVNIEDIEILSKKTNILQNGKINTSIQCKIKLSNKLSRQSFLSVVVENSDQTPWTINKITGPVGAYNIQYHQPGFLVDYENLGNEILADISYISASPQEDIRFTIYNTTRTYYYYNTYISNNYGQIDQSVSSNPVIATEGFNIKTPDALGSFSALVPTSIMVKIK